MCNLVVLLCYYLFCLLLKRKYFVIILYIVNKNYFLWLLCLWVLLYELGIVFEECMYVFMLGFNWEVFCVFLLNGCVLCLCDGDMVVWDLLVIVEYLVECYFVWLWDVVVCIWVCCVVVEMYFGFGVLC